MRLNTAGQFWVLYAASLIAVASAILYPVSGARNPGIASFRTAHLVLTALHKAAE